MFRKPVSLFLLFTLGLFTAGVYPVFTALQYKVKYEIRKSIKEGLPAEALDVIVFAAGTSPEWTEPGREFIRNGEMFDVVRTEATDSGVVYHCINDRREKALRTQSDAFLQEEFSAGKSTAARTCLYLQKLLSQNYLPAAGIDIQSHESCVEFVAYREALPEKVLIRSYSPPPEAG
jgi:hypothetical protein